MSSIFGTETLVAFGLIGIAVVIFLISRMGVLPKKTLPFIAAALAGAFGIALFQGYRSGKVKERIKKQEEELAEKEKIVEELKKKYNASDQVLQEAVAELEQAKAASKKQQLLIEAKSKEERERIDKLSVKELYDQL